MTSKKRTLAVALAGVLLLSSVAAAGTVASAATNESLTVDVENTGNNGATVSVTHDGAVENASVTVEAAEDEDNVTYAGAGNYTTGENGMVDLPEPEEDVTVEVTAEKGTLTGATTAELTAAEGNEDGSFGQLVSSFVDEMLTAGEDDGPIGQIISDYVTSNNPGNADDHGGPEEAGAQGNSSAANASDEGGSQGPPDDAGNGSDKGNGNGGGNDNGNSDETETTSDE